MQKVRVGDFTLGDGAPPFFVAELGICHGGSLKVALELTEAAVQAGAHGVKTETFDHQDMVFDPSAETSYTIDGVKHVVPLAEHMAHYQLSLEEHLQIKKLCDRLGRPFISTAHNFKAVDFLAEIKAAGIKIASPDIVHYPLLRYAASKGMPIFLDTGGAVQPEVEIAVRTLRQAGCQDIVVNHNPAGHPAPAEQHDLRVIPRLRDILGTPIGLADHYEGYEMVWAATLMGADTVEKPISQDRFAPEPERNWSISIDDLAQVIDKMNSFHAALGRPERVVTPGAEEYRNQNRMACAAAVDLPAGSEINLENITFARPRLGIGVEYWDVIAGQRLRRAKKRRQFIQWEDLDSP